MIAEACNPTGIMIEKWRAPSDTHAPYTPNFPVGERATWDFKSEAEVALAHKVKMMNEEKCFLTEEPTPLGKWDNWWQHQSHRLDAVWDRRSDAEGDRKQCKEIVGWRLKGVHADEQAARDRGSINARRAKMP